MKAYYVIACVCTLIGCVTKKYGQVTCFHFNKFSITSLAGFTQPWSPPSGVWKPLRSGCPGFMKLLWPGLCWQAPAKHQELDFQGCKLHCRWPIIYKAYQFQLSVSLCFLRFFIIITLQSHHSITPMSLHPNVVQWVSCWTRSLLQRKHTRPISSRLVVLSFQGFCLRTLEQETSASHVHKHSCERANAKKKKKHTKKGLLMYFIVEAHWHQLTTLYIQTRRWCIRGRPDNNMFSKHVGFAWDQLRGINLHLLC